MGGLIADRYELRDVVGSGGMSSVYRAYDTLLERNVALKLLHEHHSRDDDYVTRFRHEARAVAQLSHPNIVTVIDRGEQDGRQYIVFEYVEGDDLKALVAGAAPLPIRRVLLLGLDVARALGFAHAQGVVHRDVKPQNVLLTGEGHAKVTDFGIARSLDAVGNTQTGTVLGTSHYIAPEQARGERVGTETDVYSFGVVLYELLTGEVPYEGEGFLAIALQHVNQPVPSVLERRPDAPLRLAALVEACMAKEPEQRPTMSDVIAELEASLAELDARPGGEPTLITRAPRELREPRRRDRPAGRRRGLPVAVGVIAFLAAAALVAGFVLAQDDDDGGGAGGGQAVQVTAVAAHDPEGDGTERDEAVPAATDGDPATAWITEGYDDFSATKPGVGLVIEAPQELRSLTVETQDPGWTAEIRAGDSPSSFDRTVGEAKQTGATTTWQLDGAGRYYLIWLTELVRDDDGRERAHVNEVTARA